MYMIIYWQGNDKIYTLQNADKTIWLAETLEEADKRANYLEKLNKNLETRVISIEGVKE